MDLQYYLCGLGAELLRNNAIQLPKFRRLQELRSRRRLRNKASKVGPKRPPKYRAGRRHLPVGRGKYTVGCVDLMSDYSTKGVFTRLYYPTEHQDVYKREVQWPLWLPRKQYGHGYVYFRRKNTKVFGRLLNWLGGDVYVPVLWQAPIKDDGAFPVVIFTHGLGGNRTTYSTICCDIASHGFIVAALEHRDGTASMTYCYKDPTSDVNLAEYLTDSDSDEDGDHDNQSDLATKCPKVIFSLGADVDAPQELNSARMNMVHSKSAPILTSPVGYDASAPAPDQSSSSAINQPPLATNRKSPDKDILGSGLVAMTVDPLPLETELPSPGAELTSPENELPMLHVHTLGFQEQWLWYERQEKEDDYNIRNKQVYLRGEEIKRTLDLLEALNAGHQVKNVLGLHFDLRQLKGRMDLDRASIVGHSFGGATVVAGLALDKRLKCGVALDSWMLPLDESLYNKVEQPLLFINTETFQWSSNVRPMYKLNVNGKRSDRVLITLRGTCHQTHSDFQFIVPSKLGKLLELRHTLSPRVAMETNNQATLGFLFKHLNIPDEDHHDDVLSGENHNVILGTNLDLEAEE